MKPFNIDQEEQIKTWDLPTDLHLLRQTFDLAYDGDTAAIDRMLLAIPHLPDDVRERIELERGNTEDATPAEVYSGKDVYAGNAAHSTTHGFGRVQQAPIVERPRRSALRGRISKIKKRRKVKKVELKIGTKPKIRHVRTAGGQEHYDQPIGSIIIADTPLKNIKLVGQFKDTDGQWWTRVQSTSRSGKNWDIAESDHDGWQVYGVNPRNEDDMTHLAVTKAKTANEAMIILDDYLGSGKRHMPGDKPLSGSEGTSKAEKTKPKGADGAKAPSKKREVHTRARDVAERARKPSRKPATPEVGESSPKPLKKPAKGQGTPDKPPRRRGTKARNDDGLTVAEILKQSGGDRTPEDKDGVEVVGTLDPNRKPAVSTGKKRIVKTKKKKRDDPDDYHVNANGKATQTVAMRVKAHRAASGRDIPKKYQGNEKDFRLAPAIENEHLWFPKSGNSDVAYSYRQEGRDANGQLNGEFGPRRVQYTKEYMDRNQENKDARVLQLDNDMHKLDAKLEKEAVKNDTAAAVALMRILGIRVNSKSEEQQERTKGERSQARAARLEKSGVDPNQPIYGAATLQKRHVKLRDDGKVEIDFMGKEHVRNTHVTDHPLIVSLVKARLAKRKNDNDPLFPGVDAKTTQQYIRDALKNQSALNKDMRTYLANHIAFEEMSKRKAPETQDEFDIAQAEIAATVAMTLNNAAKQSLGSYISNRLWDEWKDGITE